MFYPLLIAVLFVLFLFIFCALLYKNVAAKAEIQEEYKKLLNQKEAFEQSKKDFKQRQDLILSLSKNLDLNQTVNLNSKDRDFLLLLTQFQKQEDELNSLKNNFNLAKKRILGLSFLQSDTILALQAILDANISLDSQSGAVVISSDSLFNESSYNLKSEAKSKLRKVLSEYFDAILENKELSQSLEHIIIEVHTDSQGSSYMYKLDLSHKRAYELLGFINSFYKNDRLSSLILASGKSFSQPVLVNGVEDKAASNRVKIYFTVSHKAIIEKFENFLY